MVGYRTASGARRSGDDYQDLVAAEAFLRVLKHPSRYAWVKLEAKEAGKLDDVLVLRSDGTVEATQVKYSTNALRPGDPWTWKKLLEQPAGKKSLIQDWHGSVDALEELYDRVEPRLASNRIASDDLVLSDGGKVNLAKLPSEVLECIRCQLGEKTDDFLERFRFQVDQEDLDDLDERLQLDFQELGVSLTGWLSLKDTIRSWVRGQDSPENGQIKLNDIRLACGWRQLTAFRQDLAVPNDYTLPFPEFHDEFLRSIENAAAQPVVLVAEPGVGKSTYLSFLVQELRKSGQPVIRHHYSLGPDDERSLERLDSSLIAESLMAEIRIEVPSYLGDIDIRNPDPASLSLWLIEVGRQLNEEGTRLVVVVDGLDHVWRTNQSREELRKLFGHLLPVPPGVVLVVGTQPVEDGQLPQSLLEHAPRSNWVKLPLLDKKAIYEWLLNFSNLMPPGINESNKEWFRSEVASSLSIRTGGHPLLIRYTLQRIADEGKHLTRETVDEIPQFPSQSVEDYYRKLWVGLSPEARDIMLFFSVAKFPWPQPGLLQCLRAVGYERASSLTGFNAVQHLLKNDRLGWRPFHGSLLLFVGNQPELTDRRDDLRKAIVSWLDNNAPQFWKRSYLWLLQLEAGDAGPLLSGSDHQWVLEAVAAGHPLADVVRILRTAAFEALDQTDFSKYVDRGVVADAVDGASYQEDPLRWMFAAQLLQCTDEYLEARSMAGLSELNDTQVFELALFLDGQANREGVESCFSEMNRRLARETDVNGASFDWRRRYEIVAELAGMALIRPESLTAFLANFESEDFQASLAESWLSGLRRRKEVHPANLALAESISVAVRRCLSRHILVSAIGEGLEIPNNTLNLVTPLYQHLYLGFRRKGPEGILPDEPEPPDSWTNYSYEEYERVVSRYVYDVFLFLVAQELRSKGAVNSWTPPSSLTQWLASALGRLPAAASDVASAWRDEGVILVSGVYKSTSSIVLPTWSDGGEDRRSAAGFQRAIHDITEDFLIWRRGLGGSGKLRRDELELIASHGLLGPRQVLERVAGRTIDIESRVIEDFCSSVVEQLEATIEPFGERVESYSQLALACARYGDTARADEFLQHASKNLVAYGYHKDLLLNTTLNIVEAIGPYIDDRQSIWLALAPAIAAVCEYTDGDETAHLIARLGKLLLQLDLGLGIGYVTSLMDLEQYREVEDILQYLVRTADLSDPVSFALVSTLIDPPSLRILDERVAAGDLLAKEILELNPRFSDDPLEKGTGSSSSVDSSEVERETEKSDEYLEIPPDRLSEILTDDLFLSQSRRSDKLWSWLDRWSESDRATEALEVVESYFKEDSRLQVSNLAVRTVKRIAGRTRSYDWLVRAQQTNHGWLEYWANFEEAEERWHTVQRDFPDCWHHFLADSIRPPEWLSPHCGNTLERLVKYLILFGRIDEAGAVAFELVGVIRKLVSGQRLPMPDWVNIEDKGE